MTNLMHSSSPSSVEAPVFLEAQLQAAGFDPAKVIDDLRRTRGIFSVVSPAGVRIGLSMNGDRIQVDQLALSSSVKVLHVNGGYSILIQPPHNDLPDTVKAALQGKPLSSLFSASGFDSDDVTIGPVQTLKSGALLVDIDCRTIRADFLGKVPENSPPCETRCGETTQVRPEA